MESPVAREIYRAALSDSPEICGVATLSNLFATAVPTNAAVPISDGSGSPGASLDAWVTDGSGGSSVDYIPLVTGAEPVELVSDGAGHLILIPYAP